MAESDNQPKTIGRYEIKHLLGSGAMGSVYLAEDPRIKRKLAIKVVKLEASRSESDRQEFLARFQREAEVSGLLNDPGIVTIYDVGDSDMGPFLAMEYVPGKPLDDIIKGGELPNLPLKVKLQIACGIASALDHAHSHNIVHRDVKPGNVMITEDGRPKLMDFGIAKREDASLTQTGTFLGTPSYASPEQIKEGHATYLSDVFSFGVMIFELLSGVLPFPGSSINTILYRIVNEPPMEIQPPVPGLVPDAWQRVFNRVLSKKPEDRYRTCSGFIRELLESTTELDATSRADLIGLLRQGGGTLILPTTGSLVGGDETMLSGKVKPASKGLSLGLLAAGATVVLGLGGFWLFRKGGEQVLLNSEPSEARVIKNGKEIGKTALPVSMKVGDAVRIEKDGFVPVEYVHKAGDVTPKITLDPKIVEVELKTDPSGAKVVLNTIEKGVTPLKVMWNQGQANRLDFVHVEQKKVLNMDFKVGELPEVGKIIFLPAADAQLTSGVPTMVDVNAPGIVRFVGDYTVHAKVDGKEMGEGRQISVPPGNHKLDLSNPRVFFRETRNVNVMPGRTISVELPGTVRVTVETYPNSGPVHIDGIPAQGESDGGTAFQVVKGSHTISIQGFSNKWSGEITSDRPIKFKI